jgi:hypothetical protein
MSLQAKHTKAAFSNLSKGSEDGGGPTEAMAKGGKKYRKGEPQVGEGYRLFQP